MTGKGINWRPSLDEWMAENADFLQRDAEFRKSFPSEDEIRQVRVVRLSRAVSKRIRVRCSSERIALQNRCEILRVQKKKMEQTKALRVASKWPDDKLRGSRIDWFSLLPKDVAEQQMRFERRQTILKMRAAGMTFAVIAEAFGVGKARASQMFAAAKRRRGDLPPSDVYLSSGNMADDVESTKVEVLSRWTGMIVNPPPVRDWMFL